MSINITGKNSLVEQLLAEELTKKGFKVQIISEAALSKNKWYLCFDDKKKTYVSTDESWQDEDKAGRVLHSINSEESFFVDAEGNPLNDHPDLYLAMGNQINTGWLDAGEWVA